MAGLRNAVHLALEPSGGGISHTTHTVRTSLDTVVHNAGQAGGGGARLVNGIENQYYKILKLTAKRLEEMAPSYRGMRGFNSCHGGLLVSRSRSALPRLELQRANSLN